MANILIFGTPGATGVPQDVINWIDQYNKQGHKFIINGTNTFDKELHRVISSLGASQNTTIYSMGEPRYNAYKLNVKKFDTLYNEETKQVEILDENNNSMLIIDDVEKEIDIQFNRQWYEFKDRQLIKDCDIAICIFSCDSKTAMHMIQLLNIQNKPCYTVQL